MNEELQEIKKEIIKTNGYLKAILEELKKLTACISNNNSVPCIYTDPI